jgi:quercetin dioxygenase-like cupin family protein
MKRTLSTRKITLLGAGLAATVALMAAGAALGTPAGPPGSATSTTLLDRTFGPIEIVRTSNTAQPGWTSGWHSHNGSVIVAVTKGALTFHRANCSKRTVTAGRIYVEPIHQPILARNEGTSPAAWITTQILPAGAAKRVDVTPGLCGIS